MLLIWIIIATLFEMLVALAGMLFVFISTEKLKKYLPLFISFSVGTFLGVIFLNILPEAIDKSSANTALAYTLVGFLFFFLLSRFLHWYHHHHEEEDKEAYHHIGGAHLMIKSKKATGYLVLAGDSVHNAIDGVIIALAFIVDFNVGVVTTIAVLFHEFPQEVSDFFILINSGFSKTKALVLNFAVATTTLFTAIITYFVASDMDKMIGPALGIVAGNFLYIAAADLIPELHERHKDGASTIRQFSLIVLGILLMYALILIMPE